MAKITDILPNNFFSSKLGRKIQRTNTTTQGFSAGAQVYLSNPNDIILFITATQALSFFYMAVKMDTEALERFLHILECLLATGLFTLTILKMVWSIQCPYQNQDVNNVYTNSNSTTYSPSYDAYYYDDTKTEGVCLSYTITFWTYFAFLGIGMFINELKKAKSEAANTSSRVEEVSDEEEVQGNINHQ